MGSVAIQETRERGCTEGLEVYWPQEKSCVLILAVLTLPAIPFRLVSGAFHISLRLEMMHASLAFLSIQTESGCGDEPYATYIAAE